MAKAIRAYVLMFLVFCVVSSIYGAGLDPVKPSKSDWPWWRGPTRDGKAASGQKPPVTWSETENILWKTPVEGRGHSSPIIWGNQVFLTTADEKAEEQYALCFDKDSGKQLWKTLVHKGDFVRMHKKNSQASGSPACDGERVFVSFTMKDAAWLTALDLKGKMLWQKNIGKFQSKHGSAASPAIYKDMVIVSIDSAAASFVAAYDRKTGEEIWRTDRSLAGTSFSCVSIGRSSGKDQLVLVGYKKVESYDPNTGKHFWSCDGPSDAGANTVTIGKKMVFASGGWPKRALLAIKSDGEGDVTETHVAWRHDKNTAYSTSMLLHDGLLYMIFDNKGILRVFEEKSGKELYQQEMGGECSASPMWAGGNIYQSDEAGVVTVFKPGKKFKEIAKNDLGDGGFASPVFVDSRIYIRTFHNLYCIAEK